MDRKALVEAPLLSTPLLNALLVMESNHHKPTNQETVPLWIRTKQRLDRMATFTAQRTPTSLGFDELIALREERIALASRELILLIKRWEERTPEPWYGGDASNSMI